MTKWPSLSLALAALALLVFAHHGFVRILESVVRSVLALPASPWSWILLGTAVLAAAVTLLHLTHFVSRLLR